MGAQQSNPVGIGAHSTAKQVMFLFEFIVKLNGLFWNCFDIRLSKILEKVNT